MGIPWQEEPFERERKEANGLRSPDSRPRSPNKPDLDFDFINAGIQRPFNFASPETLDLDIFD